MANREEYHRKYLRERQVKCYPKEKELQFIQNMKLQKPGMSRSAIATYLIGQGIQRLMESKNNY